LKKLRVSGEQKYNQHRAKKKGEAQVKKPKGRSPQSMRLRLCLRTRTGAERKPKAQCKNQLLLLLLQKLGGPSKRLEKAWKQKQKALEHGLGKIAFPKTLLSRH
jgi:hypothetical protein